MALSTCTRYEQAVFEQDGFITMHMSLSVQSMFAFGTASCKQARAHLDFYGAAEGVLGRIADSKCKHRLSQRGHDAHRGGHTCARSWT